MGANMYGFSAISLKTGPGGTGAWVTGTPSLVVSAPAAPGDDLLVIADDPANPRSIAGQMFVVYDKDGSPIVAIPPAGGPKVFGDFWGVWLTTTQPVIQMTPWGGLQCSPGSLPTSGGPSLYGGAGAPPNASIVSWMETYTGVTAIEVVSNLGDLYAQQDGSGPTALWQCVKAGTSLAPGGTWVPVGGGPAAVTQYAASDAPSTNSTSLVAADSAHLAVTFTAPASGRVLVRLTGVAHNAAANARWGLLNASGGAQVGTAALVANSIGTYLQVSLPVVVPGLTPGTPYTFQWAHSTSSVSSATVLEVDSGATFGPATMEVWNQ